MLIVISTVHDRASKTSLIAGRSITLSFMSCITMTIIIIILNFCMTMINLLPSGNFLTLCICTCIYL